MSLFLHVISILYGVGRDALYLLWKGESIPVCHLKMVSLLYDNIQETIILFLSPWMGMLSHIVNIV